MPAFVNRGATESTGQQKLSGVRRF